MPSDPIIIGAGPAGLAVAGRLGQRGIPAVVLEQGTRVGESWHNHYDRLHLHTVKELSTLPGKRFPAHYPRYVPRRELAEYYGAYAEERGIVPLFERTVRRVEPTAEVWKVTATSPGSVDAETFTSPHVVVATGVNRVPHRPAYEGEDQFKGRVLHSREYRNPAPFLGQGVLVVGMGNTGAEIALDLCEQGVKTALSVRGPVNAVPRDVLGRPTHLTARTLGKLPPWLGGTIGRVLQKLTVGDLTRYGIPAPTLPPIQQLKQLGKTPVVDVGTIRRIKRGEIAVYPAIDRFTEDGVTFVDGRHLDIDAVVLATGYRPQVEDLLGPCDDLLDRNGMPEQVVGRGRFEGLYFLGFDNYQPGGVLGTIVEESAVVADTIAADYEAMS